MNFPSTPFYYSFNSESRIDIGNQQSYKLSTENVFFSIY